MTVARRVVEQAIEKMDGSPLDNPDEGKEPARSSLGRMGGKGGKARAEKLSPRKGKQIAKKAAETRWSKR
jgi:hypothetical protein